MKIQELIKLEKITDGSRYMNIVERYYFNKNGYYWKIPSHSVDESVLLNNYEKECVIAYVKNDYLTILLIKTRGNYRGFVKIGELLRNVGGAYTYTISAIYNKPDTLKFLEQDEKNLIIVDEVEYSKFKKTLLLEGLK